MHATPANMARRSANCDGCVEQTIGVIDIVIAVCVCMII